jgi:hypothetical protein
MDKAEQQHLDALKHANERLNSSPRARAATFDRKTRRLVVDLENGTTFIIPVNLIQILRNATDDQIAAVEIKVHGLYLSWDELDEDLTLEHLMSGVFGTQKWMNGIREHLADAGRKGGASRSAAKTSAAIENGKKGGRPRKFA